MFDTIKKSVSDPKIIDLMMESTTDDDIRDAFLDDPELIAVGGENDPEIDKFIETIPEDDDIEPVTNEDIDKIAESAYECEADTKITDKITSGGYNEFDDEIPTDSMPDPEIGETYEDESDDKIIDRITSEAYSEFDEA